MAATQQDLLGRVTRLRRAGMPLPEPNQLADLLRANLPDTPVELDPHYADLGPFYDSRGAAQQLGGITKQALSDRRKTRTVLAMRAVGGRWLYPAWQFTGSPLCDCGVITQLSRAPVVGASPPPLSILPPRGVRPTVALGVRATRA